MHRSGPPSGQVGRRAIVLSAGFLLLAFLHGSANAQVQIKSDAIEIDLTGRLHVQWNATSVDVNADGVDIVSNQFGFLLWSTAPNNLPFYGGVLCLAPPLTRTTIVNSGGNAPPLDCSGAFSFHFSQAYMNASSMIEDVPYYVQYWYRDVGVPTLVGLTDAVEFKICQ